MGSDLSSLPDNISRVCYFSTVFLNSTLIHLTLHHTKHVVGTYRNMIITFAFIGILFSTLDILVRPLFHSYNGCVMYFTLGSTFRNNKKMAEIGLLIYSCFYSMIFTFLAVQFAYRACLVVFRKRAKYFEGWRYSLWLIYVLLCGLAWACCAYVVSPDEETDSYLRSEVLSNYGVEIRNVANFVILAYSGDGETKKIRWNSVICIIGVNILLGFQYIVVLVSGVLMYRKTHKTTVTSSHQEKLQKQFFVALIYQVVTPTIIFQLPAFVVLTAPFLGFKFSFHSGIIIYGFSAYPLMDTLIVFKVITEYKNAYKRCIKAVARDFFETMGGDTPRNLKTSVTVANTQEEI